ncbi:membrane-associated sulfatase [Photorhabdus temperata subsp. temperata M1021]|nr:membrane-associated sulfatase [Photorhabdus temperata subsp. temperata M1021]
MGVEPHKITSEIISILFDTNSNEVYTFFTNLNINEYLPLVGVLFSFILTIININKPIINNKKIIIALVSAQILSCYVLLNTEDFTINKAIKNVVENYDMIEESHLANNIKKEFSWGITDSLKQKNNIVIILGETTRGDHLGINNYPRDTTPNLSKEEIITFKDVISNAPYTLPSTPLILTRKKS